MVVLAMRSGAVPDVLDTGRTMKLALGMVAPLTVACVNADPHRIAHDAVPAKFEVCAVGSVDSVIVIPVSTTSALGCASAADVYRCTKNDVLYVAQLAVIEAADGCVPL
jgi:hypothetical protein